MALFLVIMGVQGAGKGTQAAFLKDTYHIPHVSTGELFRAMRSREDALAKRVQDILNAGLLVPDEVTNEVLQDRLEQPDAANGAILDGYPRNTSQAEWLEAYLAGRGQRLSAALLLELDPYSAFKRAFGRVSAADGSQYNIYTDNMGLTWRTVPCPDAQFPPRLEVTLTETGEILRRRSDDEAVAVIKRIDTYLESTMPLVDFYRNKGVLKSVLADQPIASVSVALQAVVDEVQASA